MNSSYDHDVFVPSKILQGIGAIVDVPRQEYSRNFAKFVIALSSSSSSNDVVVDKNGTSSTSTSATDTSTSTEYKSYRAGIIFLICLVGSIFFIWSFFLLWLKLNSNTVGCAAGKVFDPYHVMKTNRKKKNRSKARRKSSRRRRRNNNNVQQKQKQQEENEVANHPEEEILYDDDDNNDVNDYDDGDDVDVDDRVLKITLSSSIGDSSYHPSNTSKVEEISIRSKSFSQTDENDEEDEEENNESIQYDDEYSLATIQQKQQSKREKRTRIAFFLFGVLSLLCCLLSLLLFFKPLVRTQEQSQVYISASQDIVDEMNTSLTSIVSAGETSITIISNTSLVFGEVCPNVMSSDDVIAQLGIDLVSMFDMFQVSKLQVIQGISEQVTDLIDITSSIDTTLSEIETKFNEFDDYSWTIPTFVLGLCVLISVAMFGVVLAWSRASSNEFQFYLSYCLLPMLIVGSLCCWCIAIVLAATTAAGSDACIPQQGTHLPNETIVSILEEHGTNNTTAIPLEAIKSYIGGCSGADPTESITTIYTNVQEVTTMIWKSLSQVDAVGQTNLNEFCGGDVVLENFLSSIRDLAKLLDTIGDNLDSIRTTTLSCNRIYPIYVAAIHVAACTDIADATAWGFLFFLLIGITTMTMVTLRASWLHKIQEYKIYDDSEVAENMIVDEHEEYLQYISKYKHEWEEYQGLNADIPDTANGNGNANGGAGGAGGIACITDPATQSGSTGSMCNSDSEHDHQQHQQHQQHQHHQNQQQQKQKHIGSNPTSAAIAASAPTATSYDEDSMMTMTYMNDDVTISCYQNEESTRGNDTDTEDIYSISSTRQEPFDPYDYSECNSQATVLDR